MYDLRIVNNSENFQGGVDGFPLTQSSDIHVPALEFAQPSSSSYPILPIIVSRASAAGSGSGLVGRRSSLFQSPIDFYLVRAGFAFTGVWPAVASLIMVVLPVFPATVACSFHIVLHHK